MKTNYHTHHQLCGHAVGDCEEYAVEAIKQNFEVLGYSDHAPNSRVDDFGVRMKPKEFEGYLEEIETVKNKYKEQLTIKKGIEVEFFYDHDEYYEFLKDKLDYLILGQHYISMNKQMDNLQSSFALGTDAEIKQYATYVCDGIKTGHFNLLAHPDLYMCGYKDWNSQASEVAHQICKVAEEYNMILEFNGNGYRRGTRNTPQRKTQPYPRLEFWEVVKQYNIKTILSSDCHTPEHLYDTTI
jgi:histidinol-phosphatase (PHP family)